MDRKTCTDTWPSRSLPADHSQQITAGVRVAGGMLFHVSGIIKHTQMCTIMSPINVNNFFISIMGGL